MEEKRIEKHLYERHYQKATSEWSRSYYVRLKDWKGVRRVWPAGDTLKTARAKRAEYEHRNALKEDSTKLKCKGLPLPRGRTRTLSAIQKPSEQRETINATSARCLPSLVICSCPN